MHEAQESHCGNRAVWLQQRPKGFDVSKRLSDGCEPGRTLCELCSFLVVSSITSVILEDLFAPLRHGYDLGMQRSI